MLVAGNVVPLRIHSELRPESHACLGSDHRFRVYDHSGVMHCSCEMLLFYHELHIYKTAPDLLHAFKYREYIFQAEIFSLIRSIFDDGEPQVQKLLDTIARDDIWKQFVGEDKHGKPCISCPLYYTEHELNRQREEYAKWERDIERKESILEEIGMYTGWNGAVRPKDYADVA